MESVKTVAQYYYFREIAFLMPWHRAAVYSATKDRNLAEEEEDVRHEKKDGLSLSQVAQQELPPHFLFSFRF